MGRSTCRVVLFHNECNHTVRSLVYGLQRGKVLRILKHDMDPNAITEFVLEFANPKLVDAFTEYGINAVEAPEWV
jgi:hypothetical protein